jgi:GAF domain-containing protein
MTDQDLENQLAGLFFDPSTGPESEETDLLLERTIVDILERESVVEDEVKPKARTVVTEPMPAAPLATEPALAVPTMAEVPPFIPSLLEGVAPTPEEIGEPIAPPTDHLAWEARLQEQRAKILNIMLGILAGLCTVIIIFLLINLFREPGQWFPAYVPYFAAYAVLLTLAVGRQINPKIRATGLIALAYGMGVAVLLTEGPLSAGGLYLLAAPVLAAILIRQRAGAAAAVLSCLIYAGFLLADHLRLLHPSIPYNPSILPSILSLTATFVLISASVMFVQRIFNQTLTSALHEAGQRHTESVQARSLLEERANELGRANALLQKRAFQLQIAAQVSSAATSSVLDPDELIQQVVSLLKDQFNLYFVGLFLTQDTDAHDDNAVTGDGKQWTYLKAGTGEAGQQMLAMGHKVQVDASSTIGRCITAAQSHITTDAGVPNTANLGEYIKIARLLPDTRSEIALPLRSRGHVIGALTLHSDEHNAFSQEDVPVLQTMADQIAVALDNARLYAEAQENLKKVEQVQRHYVRQQWTEFLATQENPIYERTQPDVTPFEEDMMPEVEQAMTQRKEVIRSDTGNGTGPAVLVVPINLRGEAVGALGLQETESGRMWTDEEIALIKDIADQLALAIDNARLLEETQQRAEQERIIANITARVRASMDPETILRTAVRELGAALGTDRAFVRLGTGKQAKGE